MAEFLLFLRLLLALILYGFLGIVIYVLWQGLRKNETGTPQPKVVAQVKINKGKHIGKTVVLRPVTTVGREEDNTLMIDDPFTSTNHAMFLWREEQWWLEDLESHNGTYLNGERIVKPSTLNHGDRIRIGETQLEFTIQ